MADDPTPIVGEQGPELVSADDLHIVAETTVRRARPGLVEVRHPDVASTSFVTAAQARVLAKRGWVPVDEAPTPPPTADESAPTTTTEA